MSLKKTRYPLSKETMPLTYKVINTFPLKYNKKKFHNICKYSLQCIYLSSDILSFKMRGKAASLIIQGNAPPNS